MKSYITDQFELYCCSNLPFMKTIPDNCYDLTIADPPYGIGHCWKSPGKLNGITRESKYGKKDWNDKRPSRRYFQEVLRTSKHQIIWGANYFADLLPPMRGWISWDKCNESSSYWLRKR